MDWSTSVLTTGSADTRPCALVTFDDAKYMFNAPENANRALVQSHLNWRKITGMFFTQCTVDAMNGAAGTLMTFADGDIPKLSLVGPPGLEHWISAWRTCLYRPTLAVECIEAPMEAQPEPEPVYTDKHIKLFAVPVLAHATETVGEKRKREPSPDLPSKRHAPSGDSESLQSIMQSAEFIPDMLVGDEQRAYRKLLLQSMFPRPVVEANQRSRGKRKGKGQALKESAQQHENTGTDPSQNDMYRRRLPPGFHKQQPAFVHPEGCSSSNPATIAYILVGPRIRGKFDVASAERLKVPTRSRKTLTQGSSVTFTVTQDGKTFERTVQPEDVVGASHPPGTILFLDVPSVDHIASLSSNFTDSPFYRRFRSDDEADKKEYNVHVVYHVLGRGVLDDPRYIAFMKGFSSGSQHVVYSPEYSPDPVTFTGAAFNQLRLNQLDSDIFTIPKYSLQGSRPLSDVPSLPANVCMMASHLTTQMRPPMPPQVDHRASDRFHPAVSSSEPLGLPPLTVDKFTEAHREIADCVERKAVREFPGSDVTIMPLGTGSAVPTKYRNVSSTLIKIPDFGNILLDSGEGTWGQLARQYGAERDVPGSAWDVLRHLKCIFVSHLHGDHHLGVANLLRKRKLLDPPPLEPLYLVTVRQVHLYLRELHDLEDLGFTENYKTNGVLTVMSEALHYSNLGHFAESGMWQVGGDEEWIGAESSVLRARYMCESLGLDSFVTVDMHHGTRCYGCFLKHSDGWSVAFSADTMPVSNLQQAGGKATVLIHEASMGEGEKEIAQKKRHSTIGQAIDVGIDMDADVVLLNHFSARYLSIPPLKNKKSSFGADGPIIAMAFDHANLRIGTMWKMNKYLPAIKQCFMDTTEEGDSDLEDSSLVVQAAQD
ncbi:hypothetical protein FISHEDRAFT_48033 [Fistulina hepatica ATCC 64428]|uniref:ribonuclease Z n=1 Tax=Fistulina hepatica ATCC 64428 TaxID=1128425 RepID=A0A0D7A8G2_9AGAR|nr:hypothetical protein FISHEDRAFT_48033 [Fistulina hepatica ATCC 64428]